MEAGSAVAVVLNKKILGMLSDLCNFENKPKEELFKRVLRNTTLYKPQYEKTSLRGFRHGLTQTGLCSYRRWLGARNFKFRKKTNLCVAKTKVLICFLKMGPICLCIMNTKNEICRPAS